MSTVGIIANPASGKDMRRIIASGLTVTNQVKENAVQRMVLAMDCLGVERVLLMPDRSNLARRVLREVTGELQALQLDELPLPYVLGTQDDSTRAAAMMAEMGVSAMIVLGGDGTSRVVSKACGDVPLLPVSTGTNNVFPRMLEGTVVGMAAAALATGIVKTGEVCTRAPRLELLDGEGAVLDHALVDLAVIDTVDKAARAVWEPQRIRELYLTQARVDCIGMSAIGAQVEPLLPDSGEACRLVLADRGRRITAPIAPGLMEDLYLADYRRFGSGDDQVVDWCPGVVALDGERELVLKQNEQYRVRFNPAGPQVIDVEQCLQLASMRGYLRAPEQRTNFQESKNV